MAIFTTKKKVKYMVQIIYLAPFRQRSGASLQNIAQAYVKTVYRLPALDLRVNNWTTRRCSPIPLHQSKSGATLNNKYDNVCTTPVPCDMNTIYKKNLESVTHVTEIELNLFMLHSPSDFFLFPKIGSCEHNENDLPTHGSVI